MKRTIHGIATLAICLLVFNSCIFDPQTKPPGLEPPTSKPYKSLKQRDHVFFNLEKAYNEMQKDQYNRILDENFTFFFSQNDIDDPDTNVPIEWGRGREVTSATNMFSGFDPPGDEEPITDIDLDLTYTPGEDTWTRQPGSPGNHPGEDWFSKTVTYNMTIQLAGDDTFLSQNFQANFLVRFAEVNGDSIWRIIVWRDDI